MKIAVFSSKSYDKSSLKQRDLDNRHEWIFFEDSLNSETVSFTQTFDAVCLFVNDDCSGFILDILFKNEVKLILLRCAGFNNVDLEKAKKYGIKVLRVPAYSPHAVAEHALALIMTANRKTHKAYNRVRESNFSLEGLMGFDLFGKTIGVIGTGKIGQIFCNIMIGLGCKVLAYDIQVNEELTAKGVSYVSLQQLYTASDIISLQCPLNKHTHHILSDEAFKKMKDGVIIINTSRGGLIDTASLIKALKSGKVGNVAIDVYEQEENLFFNDLSNTIIQDDMIMRLISFPNVLITAHQAFFTDQAIDNIAETTNQNANAFEQGDTLSNEV